jgi:Ran GTPase-activating protein (RanGAP) involved in mRNA processing and transport
MLKLNRSLVSLNLNGSTASDSNTAIICNALERNVTLKELKLNLNKIRNRESISGLINSNRGVTKLSLIGNWIEKEGARAIAEALKHNKVIELVEMFNNPVGSKGLMAICK